MSKTIQHNEIQINREVTLSEVPNAPIYYIKEVYQNEVRLAHVVDGQEVVVGYYNPYTCFHPTDEQRQNAQK